MKKINLLIVEDHPFTRQTLAYDFKKRSNINLLGVFENGKDALDFVTKNEPDVILMDIDMPVMDGITATREIKKMNPKILVVILTSHNEKEKVFGAFQSGANAYCVKQAKTDELLNVINIVSDGGIWFDKQIAAYIFDILKELDVKESVEVKKTTEDFNITSRERNILKFVADGLSNVEIADTLAISQNTVKNHIASLINKLNVKDRTQMAVFTLKNKLLEN